MSREEGGAFQSFLPEAQDPVIAGVALQSLGALRAAIDRCNLFAPHVLLWLPTRFRIPAFARLLAVLHFGDKIPLEFLHRAAGFVHEPVEVSGHVGGLLGPKMTRKRSPTITISCIPMPNTRLETSLTGAGSTTSLLAFGSLRLGAVAA